MGCTLVEEVAGYQIGQETLWEKAALVIDRDFLNDAHQSTLPLALHAKIGLKTCLTDAYTLLTDLPKCARLLSKWLAAKGINHPDTLIEPALATAYHALAAAKTPDWHEPKFVEETCYLYKNAREKLNAALGETYIKDNDIQLGTLVRQHIQQCLNTGAYHKLLRKDDLQTIVNEAIAPTGIVFEVETDFIDLMLCVDKSLWFDAWNFLNTL